MLEFRWFRVALRILILAKEILFKVVEQLRRVAEKPNRGLNLFILFLLQLNSEFSGSLMRNRVVFPELIFDAARTIQLRLNEQDVFFVVVHVTVSEFCVHFCYALLIHFQFNL